MASTPVRPRGRTTSTTSRRRGPGTADRRPLSRPRGASKSDPLTPLLEEGLNLAEQALGETRFAGLCGLAPTLVGVAGRYARREPKKAAGLVLGLGGLFLVGRALMGSPGPSPEPRHRAPSPVRVRKPRSKPGSKPTAS